MKALGGALVALAAAGLLAGGCGGEDEAEETGGEATTLMVPGADQAASLQEEIANLSDEDQVARVGEAWAEPFAAGSKEMCGFLHPDIRGPSTCTEFTGGSPDRLQESFAGASVEEVEVTGDTAEAEFSSGKRVRFGRDPEGAWWVTDV